MKNYILLLFLCFTSYIISAQTTYTSVGGTARAVGPTLGCVGGSVVNKHHAVDSNVTNYATLTSPVGVICTEGIQVTFPHGAIDSGFYAGFYISATDVLTLVSSLTVKTYLHGIFQEGATGVTLLTAFINNSGYVYIHTTLPFNAIELDVSGLVSLFNVVNVYYGIASSSPLGGILPVTLVSFTAQAGSKDNNVLLKWSTATEQNNNYFDVERSINGSIYQPITRIQAHGNSQQQQDYEYTDNAPQTGINYYRLKQVDFDGRYSYSKIVSAEIGAIQQGLVVSPNPVKGNMNISFKGMPHGNYRLDVINSSGQVIVSRTVNVTNDAQTENITSNNFKGICILKASNINTGNIITRKVLCE
ncbi:MAG: T9SS type A sorting domain-containing protein [Chitinophagaceae bacterium]